MLVANFVLDLKARRLPLFVVSLGALIVASVALRTVAPGLKLPQFFDPLFVPMFIALTASYGLEQHVPHLDWRNPNLRYSRMILAVLHATLGLLVIRIMVWNNEDHRLEQGVRGFLVCLGILMLTMALISSKVARLIVLARTLPAAVLLPAPHSWQARIWWEFLDPGQLIGYVLSAAVWLAGLAVWTYQGSRPDR